MKSRHILLRTFLRFNDTSFNQICRGFEILVKTVLDWKVGDQEGTYTRCGEREGSPEEDEEERVNCGT